MNAQSILACILKSNPYHDADGKFTSKENSGGVTKALQEAGEDVNPDNLRGSFVRYVREAHFKELGYSDQEIAEFHERLEAHSRDASEETADKDIEENFGTSSRFGQYLEDRVKVEQYLLDKAAENADKWYEGKVKEAWKSHEQDKRFGISMYDPQYDGDEKEYVEGKLYDERRQVENVKDPTVYRKGPANKTVLSTTIHEEGANTQWITNPSGEGTSFVPTHHWKLSELKAKGYVPVAGLTSLYGYVGEGEVLFLKRPAKKFDAAAIMTVLKRDSAIDCTLVCKEEGDLHIVMGEVYAPNRPDAQGEYMTREEIRKMAHEFMRSGRLDQIDVLHDNKVVKGCSVVESFIAEDTDPQFIPGAWVVAVSVPDQQVWQSIKKGDINGFSMQALVTRQDQEVEVEIPPVVTGMTSKAEEHEHQFYVNYDEDGTFKGGVTNTVNGHCHNILAGTHTQPVEGHTHRFSSVDNVQIG